MATQSDFGIKGAYYNRRAALEETRGTIPAANQFDRKTQACATAALATCRDSAEAIKLADLCDDMERRPVDRQTQAVALTEFAYLNCRGA